MLALPATQPVSWAWHEAPRQNVTADVLARLITPGPYPKRVSLQFRPFPAVSAAEEAAGAGVCLMSLFVTVTVPGSDEIARAVAWTEAAAGSSKIRLRRMSYSQAAGFAATLPCGICPAELARRMPH